ncbi:MAG TPA: ParB/RepB/Spo0J family partition protein [Acidisarcina sp.]
MSTTVERPTETPKNADASPEAGSPPPVAPEASKRRALGRGLESLLPSRAAVVPVVQATSIDAAMPEAGVPLEIPLDKVERNPYQTRTKFDEAKLAELAVSIFATGVVQPILVRPLPEGRYQLIAGERRVLASKVAGKATIPAIVRHISDEQAMEMTIVENLQRTDLNAMEQARAFQRLLLDFKMTQEQMSLRTGKDRASIANYLRLLKLPAKVQAHLESGELSFGHGKALLAFQDPGVTLRAAERILSSAMSVRQTEIYAQSYLNTVRDGVVKETSKYKADANVREAEEQLQRKLGLKVRIEDRNGRGKVIIEYSGLEDFDAILDAIIGR